MLRKSRIPEIVLGALLAVAIFAIGFVAASSLPPPKGGVQQQNSSEHPNKEDTKGAAEERIADYTWWLAILTGVLAISTVGLWIATIFTLRHSRETAKRQLRAYLSVLVGGGVYQERDKPLRFEGKPVIVNNGPTPAHKVGFKARAAILPVPLPDNFEFPLPNDFTGAAALGPGQHFVMSAIVDGFIPDLEVDDVKRANGRALYVWGIVTYEDIFGATQHTQFSQIISWLPNDAIWGTHTQQHNRAS
jgi:hypothetical protein